jgi:hypothetical protein
LYNTTSYNKCSTPFTSQQVELRIKKLTDLVIVLTQGPFDHKLLRACAALKHKKSF